MPGLEWNRNSVIVLMVSFAALFASTLFTLYQQSQAYRHAQNGKDHLAFSLAVGDFEHAIQKERGLSTTMRSAPENRIFFTEVEQQRSNTNSVAAQLKEHAEQLNDPELVDAAQRCISDLLAARDQIDAGASPTDTLTIYTDIVTFCQRLTAGQLGSLSGKSATTATALQMIGVAKEAAGLERALVASSLAQGSVDRKRMKTLIRLVGSQDAQIEFALTLLDPTLENQLKTLASSEVFQYPERIRDEILTTGTVQDTASARRWWEIQTAKINRLHDFQSTIANRIKSEAEAATATASQAWYFAAGLALLPLLAFAGLVYTSLRQKEGLEQSLVQIQKRESTLLQECHEAVFMLSGKRIVDCNDQMLELFGFDDKSLLINSTPLTLCRELQPEEQTAQSLWQTQARRAKKEGHSRFECCFEDSLGEPILGEVTLTRVDDQEGVTILGMIYDIGERRRMEQQLAESRKLESIGQLSAGIAHEINTPMQCVFSNIEFIQSAVERMLQLTDSYREFAAAAMSAEQKSEMEALEKKLRFEPTRAAVMQATEESADASRRIIDIVRAMKTMSYQGNVEKKPCDINSLIRDSITISANRWKYVAKVETKLDDQLGNVDVNPTQISQVLLNLIVNAADAICDRVGPEPDDLGQITVISSIVDDQVLLVVEDTGKGIPESEVCKIFDPFFTTKDVGKGTGQGLAIAYDVITNQHQGAINVESKEGEGTRFQIWLPRTSNGQTPTRAAEDHPATDPQLQTVSG